MPNKVKNFIWRAAHNVLPTAINLISKRVDVPSTCSVCNAYEETVLHSLVTCSFAKSCWNSSSVGFVAIALPFWTGLLMCLQGAVKMSVILL